MKGLRIIPMFMVMIVLCYFGVLFVQANSESVTLAFGAFQTPSVPIGFAVLTAILVGMLVAGFLSILELVILYIENKQLRKRLNKYEEGENSTSNLLEESFEDDPVQATSFDSSPDSPTEPESSSTHS